MTVSKIPGHIPAKKTKRLSRLALSTCSVSLLMLAPVAHAQIVITDGQTTPVQNPAGDTVTAGEGVTYTGSLL